MVWMMKYKSKYYNIKTRASDGIVFDSHKEARRWEQLLLLQKAGKIVELQRQVAYELIPAQYETYERYSKVIPQENIIVLCDDVSMAVGRMRIRDKGSDGGHNGLKDIIRVLGNDRLVRIKLGVGQKPHPDYDLADWVLGKFSKEDKETLGKALETVPGAVRLLVKGDVSGAQNRFNR